MNYQFLNIFLDPKELSLPAKNGAVVQQSSQINQFLLENNTSQIEKFYDFYKSESNLLYVDGVLGTGKAEIVNYSTSFLAVETIKLKYNCFNSTVLDDILLSFFTEFKNLSSQNIISEPKNRSENFTQKINSYFAQIEKPFVVVLDSFESILDENRHEILDFIFHLKTMKKIKIIIIGRTFENKYFENVQIERITIEPLEKQIFEKLLKSEKIKTSSSILDELYKHTHGYYFFTNLSVKLMQKKNLSLVDFLTKYQESYLTFQKFLGQQALNLIPSEQRNLFWFLCLIRHPISINLLKSLDLSDEEKIKNLVDNLIILQDGPHVYVQDYLKDEIDESTFANIIQRIRQYIIDLYSTQLPLKPLDRNICISRQTMRKEIEYHSFFLPKKTKNVLNVPMDINYLSYTKVVDFNEKSKVGEIKEGPKKTESAKIDLTQRKNISINLENLPFQPQKETLPKKNEETEEVFNLKDSVVLIKRYSKSYQYTKVIELCQKALLMKTEKDYHMYLPLIYTKIAYSYQKIAEYENALKYYELAKGVYESANNFIKVNYIKFNIAKIFYETYQIDKARALFLEIIESKDSPTLLIVKTYLQLANLEEDSSTPNNAFNYYKLALGHVGEIIDGEVLSELYFKYALIMDDKNDVKTAIEYYDKCIGASSDPKINKFLSSTYSNIATLYLEKNDTENAVKNYIRAYQIDEETNNLEGIYYSSSKLASIMQRRHSEEALEYFHTALDCAKQLKDNFYIISASLAIGDYHYDMKQDEIALKYYLQALERAQNTLSNDNIYKINTRINDLKFRLGVEKFDNLVEIIREQEEYI